MSLVGSLTTAATIVSGILSAIVLLSILIDALTRGWVRGRARAWLGINEIHKERQVTQTFLQDMGQSHNELAHLFSEELDVPEEERPTTISVDRYGRILNNGTVEKGMFLEEE